MKNLLITLTFLLMFNLSFGQDNKSKEITHYAVQLFSTTIYPYPYEDELYRVCDKDSLYVEKVEINGKIYYRYLVKCYGIENAKDILVNSRTFYFDAFIVYYYKNNKRFN